jgi:hypothetical protein
MGAMTGKTLLCAVLVFLILFLVPFPAFAVYAALTGAKPPGDPSVFMVSVALEKIGHTIAFVGIFCLARRALGERWLRYAAAWWVMFVVAEAALAIRSSEHSWAEGITGMAAETIYLPLAALVTHRLLAGPAPDSR